MFNLNIILFSYPLPPLPPFWLHAQFLSLLRRHSAKSRFLLLRVRYHLLAGSQFCNRFGNFSVRSDVRPWIWRVMVCLLLLRRSTASCVGGGDRSTTVQQSVPRRALPVRLGTPLELLSLRQAPAGPDPTKQVRDLSGPTVHQRCVLVPITS